MADSKQDQGRDEDERRLEKLGKTLLSTPHKPREPLGKKATKKTVIRKRGKAHADD